MRKKLAARILIKNVFNILKYGAIKFVFLLALYPLDAAAQTKSPKQIDMVVKIGNAVAGCVYAYRIEILGKNAFLTLRDVNCGIGPGRKNRISTKEGLVFPLNSTNMEELTCALTRASETCSDGSKRYNPYGWLRHGQISKETVTSARYTNDAISLSSQTSIRHSKAWNKRKRHKVDIMIDVKLNGGDCTVTRFTENYHGSQTNERLKKQISCRVAR